MSDFLQAYWSAIIAYSTGFGLIACLAVLLATARAPKPKNEQNTTGHVWDEDLVEMNNPLPRWWMWLFIGTLVFAGVYLALYPGMGAFQGRLGWTQAGQYAAEVKQVDAAMAPVYARFDGLSHEQLATDRPAMAIGERLFMNNCAQCHGSDGRGSRGYPNLADKDWLHGGTQDAITTTIREGRIGSMPPMAAAVGSPEDVRNVAHYVLSLSGSPHDTQRAQLGRSKFSACVACHGVGGKGNSALGAPNLSDGVWLHGSGETAIVSIINNGKVSTMPAQKDKLTDAQIRLLAAYVWGMSKPQVLAATSR